jgi:hypothetical protein
MPLTETQIRQAIQNICDMSLFDEVTFKVISIEQIRKDDIYGGFCVRLDAMYDTIVTPLSIDISTGDVMTPSAVSYDFGGIFDEAIRIRLWGYNIETVLAEKVETILSRGIFSTRPRDYYDVYILVSTQSYDKVLFVEALAATAEHRGSKSIISDVETIFINISESSDLRDIWRKYQKKFLYAQNVTFEATIEALRKLLIL